MIIIAIDGPAGSGKGTLAGLLAEYFNFPLIETGLFYRALAYRCIQKNINLDDVDLLNKEAESISIDELNNNVLRGEDVACVASKVSAHPSVRSVITDKIRQCALKGSTEGIILDGRDVGTHIFPNADIKFYVTASVYVRALRRKKQLQNSQQNEEDYQKIMQERDDRDKNRTVAPLEKAHDAAEIDTSDITIPQALELMISHIRQLSLK